MSKLTSEEIAERIKYYGEQYQREVEAKERENKILIDEWRRVTGGRDVVIKAKDYPCIGRDIVITCQ